MVLEQPSIGMELKDHPMIRIGATVKQDAFHVQPLPATADDIAAAAQGYLKLDPGTLPALANLGEEIQSHLRNDRTPTHELLLVSPRGTAAKIPDRMLYSLWPAYRSKPGPARETPLAGCACPNELPVPRKGVASEQ